MWFGAPTWFGGLPRHGLLRHPVRRALPSPSTATTKLSQNGRACAGDGIKTPPQVFCILWAALGVETACPIRAKWAVPFRTVLDPSKTPGAREDPGARMAPPPQ